ncbi:hypothetical protein ACFVQ3_18600 [Oerskovia sp. NPDC057915]|uniref:hypothetical protein n=1 Tax=Oerskovia sp. NPDC057915 TaxID=3346280 RepID=UPI0036D9A675
MSGHYAVAGVAKTINDIRYAVAGVAKQVRYIVQNDTLLWSLKTMFWDAFNRPNLTGPGWIKISSQADANLVIPDGASARGGTNARMRYVWPTPPGGQPQWAEAVVAELPVSSEAGVVLRSGTTASSNATCMFATLTPTGWRAGYIGAGNVDPTTWASGTRTFTPGDRIRAEITTNSLLVYINDALVHTQTGTTYTGTYIGLRAVNGGRIDRWCGGAL